MFGRWMSGVASSVALLFLNVLHPGRETQGCFVLNFISGIISSLMSSDVFVGAVLAVATIFVLVGASALGTQVFMETFCNLDENPPEFTPKPIPFRKYRGMPEWKKSRVRPPRYYLLKRWGRHSALRFRDGKAPIPRPQRTRFDWKPKREKRKKCKKASDNWGGMTAKETAANRADEFERIKPKFLHDTFVMYEMQYGVNLDEFVKEIDPLKSFELV